MAYDPSESHINTFRLCSSRPIGLEIPSFTTKASNIRILLILKRAMLSTFEIVLLLELSNNIPKGWMDGWMDQCMNIWMDRVERSTVYSRREKWGRALLR